MRPNFDSIRETIEVYDDLRNALQVRTQYSSVIPLRLGKLLVVSGAVEQRGLNASVDSVGKFTASTARFRPEDKGKEVTVLKSAVSTNLKTVRISSVVDTNTVITDPLLSTDTGPVQWEVRGFPPATDGNTRVEIRSGDITPVRTGWILTDGSSEIGITARRNFAIPRSTRSTLTEKEGRDGVLDSLGRLVSPTGKFTPRDIGKKLAISGSTAEDNNGWSEIVYYKSATTVATSILEIQGADSNGHVRYFLKGGVSGVRVFHRAPDSLVVPSVSYATVSGSDITVQLGSDGIAIDTTASQIVTIINANPLTSVLVGAEASGTGASVAGTTADFETVTGYGLSQDAGPLSWAVLPFPTLVLRGSATPRGVVEQDGVDLHITASSSTEATVRSITGRFSAEDVGKILTIFASPVPKNNLTVRVKTYVNPREIILSVPYALTTTAPFATSDAVAWELRTSAYYEEDLRRVQASAPSVITSFAQDFGIEVDTLENESRQRSYVEHANQWFDLKGAEKGYEILGTMSGVEVDARQAFRVNKTIYLYLPAAYKYVIPEKTAGKFGITGTLYLSAPDLMFTSTEAIFDVTDTGRVLQLTDTPVPANDKLYTIAEVLSSTVVKLAFGETADTLPMSLTALPSRWSVVRLYSDKPPLRPRYDEIDSDKLRTWVVANLPGKTFSVDMYCWEDRFAAYVNVNVVSAALTSSGRYLVTVTGPADVAVATGRWFLNYDDGTEIFMETVPVASADWEFEVATSIPPALGAAKLQYSCPVTLDCSYCGSYRILCIVTSDVGVFDTAKERENLEERITTRLQQVVPAHAELIVLYRTRLTATLRLDATAALDGSLGGGPITL